jgi:putative chitinase
MSGDLLFFNLARRLKRRWTREPMAGLSQAEVDEINAVIQAWKQANAPGEERKPVKLEQPTIFFQSVRAAFGQLSQEQVEGFNAVLKAMGEARWPISWVAYGLATAWHETAHTMQPVEEAFWKDDAWRARNLRYYPWHGRGYVQLTWEANYRKADEECGLEGKLLADSKLAMRPDIAAQIMVRGMEQGWFTNKKLADYLPIDGHAGHDAYKAARRIINGTDRASEIAKMALSFEAALDAGGWV